MDNFIKKVEKIEKVHIEEFDLKEPFIDLGARFADMEGTVLLMSGTDLASAGFHILSVMPWLYLKGKNYNMSLTVDRIKKCFEKSPIDIVRQLLLSFRCKISGKNNLPVCAGLFGYFSYDLKDYIENLPKTSIDSAPLPDICLYSPLVTALWNKKTKQCFLCVVQRPGADAALEKFKIEAQKPLPKLKSFEGGQKFVSNFNKDQYIDSIKIIKNYIEAGDVYQVNMSQRFETNFKGEPFSLFKALYQENPAPFFAFINAGEHHIISTSPERFIKREGDILESRPIKGTRPRGNTQESDKKMRDELEASLKDDAELSMIVDLIRNDLGKVCRAGSVKVAAHKNIETYKNVYHLVSVVNGILENGKDSTDVIEAMFPGGSITGCPKIRAMEIIDELETHRRHMYTGSIGYLSFHDTMDLSIAIRTAVVYKDRLIFSVGGGVVYDSDPQDEFEETLHKGKTLLRAFDKGDPKRPDELKQIPKSTVWLNGKLVSLEDAHISVMDQGFLYGFGFFETILSQDGNLCFLKDHVDRFQNAWLALLDFDFPDLAWEDIIKYVLERNSLTKGYAAVKIAASAGIAKDRCPTILVSARPYTDRLKENGKNGLSAAIYPYPRLSYLAGHKTLNYLYYLLAQKWAQEHGADEAIILNPDKSISETATAGIVAVKGKNAYLPVSDYALPSIMQKKAVQVLESLGFKIYKVKLMLKDFCKADCVMFTNSLMGAAVALSIDKKRLNVMFDLCKNINKKITD